ncbi:putative v-type H+-ATPase subunit C [Alteracholeplasma palmae J233]|uniref:Putative v-type H+-ATPase subunit C n=2 Tax=Acholeplasma palmae TaxID=38986 RepID=U4KLD3_ALTPJ|nr:putative v-type H+-ATPase subunit C [Alteracholeplasma palmae J233]
MEKKDLLRYLYHDGILIEEHSDFKLGLKSLDEALKYEISSYIGKEHLVYQYFFSNQKKSVDFYNTIYNEIKPQNILSEIISYRNSVKNIIMAYRLCENNEDVLVFKSNMLKQNQYEIDRLETAYIQGKKELIQFTKSELNTDVDIADSVLKIDRKLSKQYLEYIKSYAYSTNLLEILIYYIVMRKNQINQIKSIYYLNEVCDE